MYAVPDKISQADYALDAAVTLLEFYEDYFSIPYPLPKQGSDFAQFYKLWHLMTSAIDYLSLISIPVVISLVPQVFKTLAGVSYWVDPTHP